MGAIGLSQRLDWFYGTKIPSILGGQVGGAPVVMMALERTAAPLFMNVSSTANGQGLLAVDQWTKDFATPSTFTGTVTGGGTSSPILTLNTGVTGTLWEGEILGCNPYSTACAGQTGATPLITLGTQITGILSGTWGASGSTYSLTSPSGPTGVVNVSSQPMMNEAYYTGAGGVVWAGSLGDIAGQDHPLLELWARGE